MSSKYLVFDNKDNDLYYLRDGALYEVTAETYSLFEIKDDDGDRLDISKSDSIYDYEVIESYPVPDNIPYWEPATDNVNKPSHYNQGDIETIDFINQVVQAYNGKAGFHAGNIIKYVARAPHKNGKEDLEKAKVYIDWAIEHFEG